jgi:hypothetical protein
MGYVVAGYAVVLSLLFLYGLQLVWRRRQLTRAGERVEMSGAGGDGTGGADSSPAAGPAPANR